MFQETLISACCNWKKWQRNTYTLQVQVSWGSIHEWRMQDEELYILIGKEIAIMRTLHYSVVVRWALLKKAKLSIFETVFVLFTNCISIWSWKFGNDWKGAIASAIVQTEVSPKNWRSYIIDKMRLLRFEIF